MVTFKILFLSKYSVNPLYPALERLPFSGFQSLLIADRRGSVIRPAIETLQKANRFKAGRGWQLSQRTTGLPNIYIFNTAYKAFLSDMQSTVNSLLKNC